MAPRVGANCGERLAQYGHQREYSPRQCLKSLVALNSPPSAFTEQTTAVEDTLERVAAGESELARAESELRRLIASNGTEIMDLRTGQNVLRESSE